MDKTEICPCKLPDMQENKRPLGTQALKPNRSKMASNRFDMRRPMRQNQSAAQREELEEGPREAGTGMPCRIWSEILMRPIQDPVGLPMKTQPCI